LLAFIIYTSFGVFNVYKSKCKMDAKAWANIGVNIISFGAKAIIWTYMIS
jgi:hypothetical protein